MGGCCIKGGHPEVSAMFFSLLQVLEFYADFLSDAKKKGFEQVQAAMRELALKDLFFLLFHILNRRDINHPWLYERVREVEASPNGYLDLWAREHYKSTIISFGLSIQDILWDPEITIGIFSFNRPTSKSFLRPIKWEMESNQVLKTLFPDILYQDPGRESPKWSEDDGLIVKRKTNPKEATVEAWGLIEGMPTAKHYKIRVYDDIITERQVTNPEMIKGVITSWELSLNLGSQQVATRYGVSNIQRYAGTRYHLNDPYREIVSRGTVKERKHPGTVDGTADGEPVLLNRETILQKRREMGPYVFGCHSEGTKILMSDWTEKPIEDVEVGDEVIGFQFLNRRTRLTNTAVLAKHNGISDTQKCLLESGRSVVSTPDHMWWTGRPKGEHRTYNTLGFGYKDLHGLIRAYCPPEELSDDIGKIRIASWLGGFFDGEGSFSGAIHMYQSEEKNPIVCKVLREYLAILGFDWGETPLKRGLDFWIKGGKTERLRFLKWCQPVKQKSKFMDSFLNTKNGNYRGRDRLIDLSLASMQDVFNIRTVTGNYIANGYASKNCQILLNPVADEAQGFKAEWIRYWPKDSWDTFNLYLLCDPAGEKKKTNDYTVMLVIGLGEDRNYYLIDGIRDRLNLTERTDFLFKFHRQYHPVEVGYEKYGKDSDIEHIQYVMDREKYRFNIKELGGPTPKNDRIRRLIPIFEQGRMYFPSKLSFIDHEGKPRDLVREFITDEYCNFPVGTHDDIFDCMARIVHEELGATFPGKDSILKARTPDFQEKFGDFGWML